ncbi:MAG: hypothetical protein BGO70_13660 [Bacteroidetes bacterium 43-93]|nr:hypothetical protein [Bacteroidota bacterium]OJW99482.1 MAG: hypothetical protein BGO70_13660 [Bacteroidetes bacterium 43-93]
MNLKRFLYLSCLVASAHGYAQAPPELYSEYIKEANKYYDNKEYQKSANAFTNAFASFGGKGYVDDRYNAACSWSLAGNTDSAFFQLFRIAEKTNYSDLNHLAVDPDLEPLRKDNRWQSLYNLVKANKEKNEAGLNKSLVAILDTVKIEDQKYRMQIESIEKKYGRQSKEITTLWQKIKENDSANLLKVTVILDKYGWLGAETIGVEGNNTLFLVIQHADIETQQKYLPMMREAVKTKRAQPSSLAMLEDRVAIRTGGKQIYGSQIAISRDGKYYVDLLEDPDNVDKRRAEVGLESMSSYISHWKIKWDVEEHKKMLSELEHNQKIQLK